MALDLDTESEPKLTPVMEQWAACKRAAKGALLLFRLGDFYEAFYEDAEILANALDLALTKRQGIPMSGIPFVTCENHLEKLVAKGCRVAIAEQIGDPKAAKGLVPREIVRFITPGTASSGIAEKTNNFMISVYKLGSLIGLAALDLSTGEFKATEVEGEKELLNEMEKLRPSEIVCCDSFQAKCPSFFKECTQNPPLIVTVADAWLFEHENANRVLTRHFSVQHLDGFGLKGMVAAINAAGALLSYIRDELSISIAHIRSLQPYHNCDAMRIDRATQKNLEIAESLHSGKSLLETIDKTQTPMGGRKLRQWLLHPLLSVDKLQERLDAVDFFYFSCELLAKVRKKLKEIGDLERLAMRVSSGCANPRHLLSLAFSLEHLEPLKQMLSSIPTPLIQTCCIQLTDMKPVIEEVKSALIEDPPLRLSDGNLFKKGYHPPLDALKEIARSGKEWMAHYQNKIREETGIKTKVSFNKNFGYYIEVSKGQAKRMPESFQRRQTLVNSERYITEELKEYEEKVLTAEGKISALEAELFQSLLQKAALFTAPILTAASAVACIDVICSFAESARTNRYCRPSVDHGNAIEILKGRHPVVETVLPQGEFIENDTLLNPDEQLMVITGPNMAGKSTYIRQVALIVIMAQTGSFVPADRARIGLVDKVFTRIGASDDLSRGQSTFMVEMSETANILNNATDRSLVILDEVGRGTSTYDGLSIAWAVAEYLLTTKLKQAKTLFATHYWELTGLEGTIEGAVNYHAAAEEWKNEIVFLHKIARGGADRSYGIHVARLAGLPLPVITRAFEILEKLEQSHPKKRLRKEPKDVQLLLFN